VSARAEPWGGTGAGEEVTLFTLERDGVRARIASFGCTLVGLELPDRAGRRADVVLGFDALAGYESARNPYMGGLVGRCANRIGGARFVHDGREVRLAANEGRHHLHGGVRGFDRRAWTGGLDGDGRVVLARTSPAGEEGYPGSVEATATWALEPGGALALTLEARCDAPTPVNLAPHPYLDLSASGSIHAHALEVRAERYVAVDDELVPTGALRPVEGTPFDFRRPHAIGARLEALRATPARGYDLCYALDPGDAAEPRLAARLVDPGSGRGLELRTTRPGLQLYTGNHLDGLVGKGGRAYAAHAGVCLEPQGFPDAPNHPAFPSVLLRPGERFHARTVWRPSVV